MRNFKGINLSGIQDARTRAALDELQLWAQDVAAGMGKITKGFAPNVKNILISGTTSHHNLTNLTDGDDHPQYLYLANRTGGQTISADASNQIIVQGPDTQSNTAIFKVGYKPTIGSFIDLVKIRGKGDAAAPGPTVTINNDIGTTNPTLLVAGVFKITHNSGYFNVDTNSAGTVFTDSNNAIGFTGTYSGGTINLSATGAAVVPLWIKGAVAQTANLTEWKNSASTILAYVDKDGNINAPGFVLTGGDAYAKKAANETITGQWIFQPTAASGKTVIKEDTGVSGTGYFFEFQDGAGTFLAGMTQGGTSNPGSFVATSLGVESGGFTTVFTTTLTANRFITIPGVSGEMCLIAATQNISNKTLTTTGNTLRSIDASTGVAFVDNTTTTKLLRFVLSGATGSNSIIVSSTAARAYTLPDKTGTIPVLTTYNTQKVVYWPAHSFYSVASYATLGTDPAGASGAILAPVGQTYVNIQFRVPNDYVSGGSITMYVATDGVDTNHYVLKGNYAVIAATGAVDAAGTALTGATGIPPGTGNKLATPGMGSVTVTAGDFVRLTLYRDAGDAGDTCADNVIFFGAALIYTSDM